MVDPEVPLLHRSMAESASCAVSIYECFLELGRERNSPASALCGNVVEVSKAVLRDAAAIARIDHAREYGYALFDDVSSRPRRLSFSQVLCDLVGGHGAVLQQLTNDVLRPLAPDFLEQPARGL